MFLQFTSSLGWTLSELDIWSFIKFIKFDKYPIKQAGFLCGLGVKNPPAKQEKCKRHWFNPWVRKILWIEYWQPTLVFLPGGFHGQRSKAGYSPRNHRVRRDWMTEHTCKVGSIFGSVDAKYIYQRQIFPKISLQRCHSYELNLGECIKNVLWAEKTPKIKNSQSLIFLADLFQYCAYCISVFSLPQVQIPMLKRPTHPGSVSGIFSQNRSVLSLTGQ